MQSARRSSPRPTSLATPWLPLPAHRLDPARAANHLDLRATRQVPRLRRRQPLPAGLAPPRRLWFTPRRGVRAQVDRGRPRQRLDLLPGRRHAVPPRTVQPRFLRKQYAHNKAHPGQPLPRLKLHGLRHTWATLALEEGIDIHVVSDRLGHSSTHITSEIYTQVRRPLQSDAAVACAARGSSIVEPDDGARTRPPS
ncbi:MAG: tyrosine-type recombinase/integrase [Microthrixaceae bacterium]